MYSVSDHPPSCKDNSDYVQRLNTLLVHEDDALYAFRFSIARSLKITVTLIASFPQSRGKYDLDFTDASKYFRLGGYAGRRRAIRIPRHGFYTLESTARTSLLPQMSFQQCKRQVNLRLLVFRRVLQPESPTYLDYK